MPNPFDNITSGERQATASSQVAANPFDIVVHGTGNGGADDTTETTNPKTDTVDDAGIDVGLDEDGASDTSDGEGATSDVDDEINEEGAIASFMKVVNEELPKIMAWYRENRTKLTEISGLTSETGILAFVGAELIKNGGKLLIENGIPFPDLNVPAGLSLGEAFITMLMFWNPIKGFLAKKVQAVLAGWGYLRWFGRGATYSMLGLNEEGGTVKKAVIDQFFHTISDLYPAKIFVDVIAQFIREDLTAEDYALGAGSLLSDKFGNTYELLPNGRVKILTDSLKSDPGDTYELKYYNGQREYYIDAKLGAYYPLTLTKKVEGNAFPQVAPKEVVTAEDAVPDSFNRGGKVSKKAKQLKQMFDAGKISNAAYQKQLKKCK